MEIATLHSYGNRVLVLDRTDLENLRRRDRRRITARPRGGRRPAGCGPHCGDWWDGDGNPQTSHCHCSQCHG